MGDEQFYYNGNRVEIVNTFSYLGLLLNYNGKFNVTQKHIAEMGKKSLFCFMKEVKNHSFNITWWSIDELENLHADRTTVCFEPW